MVKGAKHSPETIEKMKAAASRRWGRPKYRDRQTQSYRELNWRRHRGAFSTEPGEQPAIAEFDAWEY